MANQRYLSAQEVAAELGISVQTVYAYVSRGLLRSEREGGHAHRYLRDDVDTLKQRKEGRRNPTAVAASALYWGTPVLDSSIALIADEQLYYRGYRATRLAVERSIEQVAALIWLGNLADRDPLFRNVQPISAHVPRPDLAPLDAFSAVLPVAALDDLAAYDLRPAALARTGARVLHLLTAVAAGTAQVESSIAQTLARRWAPDDERALPLLNAALILCADHELNVSSFTARCVASAGAPLYAVVSAGLAALSGIKHGKQTEWAVQLLADLAPVADVRTALAHKLKLGQAIPGFGHVLYPGGDPRGRLLLELVSAAYPAAPTVTLATSLVSAAREVLGDHPTLDLGLAVVSRALRLPPGGALGLFALGRTVGWIGHALEQYAEDKLIRPRARYVGEMPRG
ncbi:MAG: helix-turn-helix domain-containing protein [Herpetosiphonaceae bacterium]|nr:helix-turn-helix domain-containing protein [Herpetosiphonaceae bacterium]